jgi:transposase
MKEPITSYVGLDIHKDSIAIAIAKAGRDAPQFIGTTVAQLAQVRKVLTRQRCTPDKTLVVYEAGPCGYGWARYLNTNGWRCEVISPAHVVRSAAGKAIKTDRRDALLLARESRAGNLTPIAVPDERDEAIRDLSRAREDAIAARGFDFIAAVTIIAELGDLNRFSHPRALMSYLGLVPSEHSSGNSRRQGAITRTGNRHARRILVESAWTYRYGAHVGREHQIRQQGQPKAIRDIAWKAQLRLTHRYRKLSLGRKMKATKVCVAVARELCGFIWDLARHVPVHQ